MEEKTKNENLDGKDFFCLFSEPAEGNVRQGDPNPTSPE